MTTRRFEMDEGGSRKFWEVAVEGSVVTVRFGRIGTEGQAKPKDLGSEDAARNEATKLVAEKTKKGYVEVTAGSARPEPAPPAARETPPVAAAPPPSPPSPAAPAAPAAPLGPQFAKLYVDGEHRHVTWSCHVTPARRRVDPDSRSVVAAIVRGWAVTVRSRDEAEALLASVQALPGDPPREPAALLAYTGWEISDAHPRQVVVGAILAARASDGGRDRELLGAKGPGGAHPAVLRAREAWADEWVGAALAGVHPAIAGPAATYFVAAGEMGDAYLVLGTIGKKVPGLPFARRLADSSGKKSPDGLAGVLLAHAAWDEGACVKVDLSEGALAEPLAKVAAAVAKPLIALGASYDSRS